MTAELRGRTPGRRPGASRPIPNTVANALGIQVPGTQELYGLEFESGYALTDRWDVQLNLSWNQN